MKKMLDFSFFICYITRPRKCLMKYEDENGRKRAQLDGDE